MCGWGDDSSGDEKRSVERMTPRVHVFVCVQCEGVTRHSAFQPHFLTHIDCAFRKGNATQQCDAAGPKTSYFL